ncbi:glycosyltransferase [Carboxylicivirga linearis]|uniref:Glycosyltransferase family 4 protein n=1 Tax=Carboxylicivirga linearis TaxID=1628157 RepID=A0ABS5JVZ1_9BACT|nr:glycosyltransferase [Carboxylicivirga linearis]MBS2099070.1 glycosyltransferase family 4 protein [Carboxylicivirga linearis]
MKLVIISHTEHYINDVGRIVGWGSTVNEINHLLDVFEEVIHCAPFYKNIIAPDSSMAYQNEDRIRYIPLKPYGGDRWFKKFSVLTTAPYNLLKVWLTLKKADVFQFRAPTGMGLYMIPFLRLCAGKKGWFKYAGNWKQPNAPLGYRVQKYFLTHFSKHKVTINGAWHDQPSHCLSFENPCLEEADIKAGQEALKTKSFDEKLDFIFVGRLEMAKGVGRILEAFGSIESDRIGVVHMIGDGEERTKFESEADKLPYDFNFYGFMSRDKIFELLQKAHVFLLPSDSEGFPKVLAEAINFGCLPIVSKISCLPDYVKNEESGFLVDLKVANALSGSINKVLSLNGNELLRIASLAQSQSDRFTFHYYNQRIINEAVK